MILLVVIIAAVLIAVLVAVAVPALIQLRRTLKSAQLFLDTTGVKLNRTLDDTSSTTATLRRAADHLEASAAEIARLFDAVGHVAGSLERVSDSLRNAPVIFGAVAAATTAAVRAVKGSAGPRRDEENAEEEKTVAGRD